MTDLAPARPATAMFSTCLHCHGALGGNEEVQHFAVGRKLAFDAAKGRLWVVCPGCRRWNLTPLEERWEAIDECKRLFAHTKLRVATENVGLARVSSRFELVRVGAPARPEMAAWRYGESLRRRWKSYSFKVTAALAIGPIAGTAFDVLGQSSSLSDGAFAAVAVGAFGLIFGAAGIADWRSKQPRVLLPDGRIISKKAYRSMDLELHPLPGGWGVRTLVATEHGGPIAVGSTAVHTLRGALTTKNFTGARPPGIDRATALIAESSGSGAFIRRLARAAGDSRMTTIAGLPDTMSIALEMALHEDSERRALEGELASLTEEWVLAEEIAAIADGMLLPEAVSARLAQFALASSVTETQAREGAL